MANSSINLVNLDFDTLRNDFLVFLQNQDQFKDYNFDGSNISVLLDLLGLNTFKNAFYLNMIHAEGFLDSAQLRESIYSHAKELNYLPRSAKSAVANVTLTFSATGRSQPYVIRKGETFTTLIRQGSYSYSLPEDVILTSSEISPANSSLLVFRSTFNIYEGYYLQDSYVVDNSEVGQKFKITNTKVDTDSLTVLVYENNEATPKKFTRATTLLGLNENSEVYFIQPSFDGNYEILFGDSILGRRPVNGSTVVLDYRVTGGSESNGAKVFSPNFDPTGANEMPKPASVVVNRYSPLTKGAYSVNGAEAESLDSIRYYAPRHFQTQERAVTYSDYEILMKSKFPEINAITAYGGEEANPPRYGSVYIAVDVRDVDGLPESKKVEYQNFIDGYLPLAIDPIFIDPDKTYIQVNSKIKYNLNITTRSPSNIKADATMTVTEYADETLNDFRTVLRYSKFTALIDSIDTSVVSNETDLFIYKKIIPRKNIPQNIDFNFLTRLWESDYMSDRVESAKNAKHKILKTRTVTSSRFTYKGNKCTIEDDGLGVLKIVREESGFHYVVNDIGFVDYTTGTVKLINFNPETYEGNFFKVYCRPMDKDIMSAQNVILSIEPEEIFIDVEAIRE